jgi:hypothetical protein
VYTFAGETGFEGELAGALDRIESGGALRVVEVLFVQRVADTGELAAFEHQGDGAGGVAEPLLGFRLDAAERAHQTRRALDSVAGPALREVGEALDPGVSLAAVFVAHVWAETLSEAARRTGGTLVASEFVDADVLASELAR